MPLGFRHRRKGALLVLFFLLIYRLLTRLNRDPDILVSMSKQSSPSEQAPLTNPTLPQEQTSPQKQASPKQKASVTDRVYHDGSSHRCIPFALKFHVDEPLFDCNWILSLSPNCTHRLRAKLVCRPSSVDIEYEWVSVNTPPSVYGFNDSCLARVVKAKCFLDGKDLIPNLSHHVFFGGNELKNYTFLSIISAVRFLQPCLVMVQADVLPSGRFWDTVLRLVPQLIHVKRLPPSSIFGNKIRVVQHSSDIARMEAILKFGGVYQDADYIWLNPVEDLRGYSLVMGITNPGINYCNCVFMGNPKAPFLQVWYDSYRTFQDSKWGYHSTILPYKLHKQRPELEFQEVNTLVSPYFGNIKRLFYENIYYWKRLHGVHLLFRHFSKYFAGRFDQQNSSLGQVTRHILFGDSKACFGDTQQSHHVVRMNITNLLS